MCTTPHSLILLLVLSGASAGTLCAQRLGPAYLHGTSAVPDQNPRVDRPPDDLGMGLAGLVFGAGGLVAGAYIGSALGGGNRVCGDDPCGFEEAVWGAAAGMSFAIPLGVHLGNHHRGNFGLEVATSLAIGAAGIVSLYMFNSALPMIAIPVAQLLTSIAIERRNTGT